jgi:hypothetical protein
MRELFFVLITVWVFVEVQKTPLVDFSIKQKYSSQKEERFPYKPCPEDLEDLRLRILKQKIKEHIAMNKQSKTLAMILYH